MKKIHVQYDCGAEQSAIVCCGGVLSGQLAEMKWLKESGALIFTDSNVHAIYGADLKKYLPDLPVHIMPAGEKHKNEETLFSLLTAMAEAGLRRDSVLIAFGGGVVGDVGGLAASLYMRGIRCIQVPTTLLAQVDSSVGGKTAIDFHGIKNLVGAFHLPTAVYVDPTFLYTLPPREIVCGLGEIVKHAALNGELFDALSARENLTDPGFLADIVPENIAFKAKIVQSDPFDRGVRACLNLGHTTAHAVELGGDLSHGACVLIGIRAELRLAKRLTACDAGYLDELDRLAKRALGTEPIPDFGDVAKRALSDKKNTASGLVTMVVPVSRGKYGTVSLSVGEYATMLGEIREELC